MYHHAHILEYTEKQKKRRNLFLFPHLIIRIYIHIRICHFSNTQKGTRLIEYSSTLYCCCHHHEDKMNSCCLLLLLLTSFHAASRNQKRKEKSIRNLCTLFTTWERRKGDYRCREAVERMMNEICSAMSSIKSSDKTNELISLTRLPQ